MSEEIKIHVEYIRDICDRIDGRLDTLNGRTRKVESMTAVHSGAIALIGAAALALFVWVLSKI